MRLNDRLSRLERTRNTGLGMTADELASASAEFTAKIDGLGDRDLPEGITPEQASEAWHSVMANTKDPLLQRVFASANPADLYV